MLHFLSVGVSFGSCSSLTGGEEEAAHQSPLLEAIFFAFAKEICLRAPQIDNLWATISIFLLDGALLTIIGIRNPGASTDPTASLVRAIVTFITYAHQDAGTHIGVTDHTLAITFSTPSCNGNTSLLAAKDQVRVMFSHSSLYATGNPLFCFLMEGYITSDTCGKYINLVFKSIALFHLLFILNYNFE